MNTRFKNVLIVADIEGSSGCWDYRLIKRRETNGLTLNRGGPGRQQQSLIPSKMI